MQKMIVAFLVCFLLPSVSIAREYWGALAYSKLTGRAGYSWNQYGPYKARRAALRRCGRQCRVLIAFQNSCIALAVGRGAYGWARYDSRYTARRRAKLKCRSYGGRHCKIKVSVCNGRGNN